MPSSPGYVRDYAQEHKTAVARGERGGSGTDDAKRSKLRRSMIKAGKVKRNDGKDVDHVKMLSKGGANTHANARVVSPGVNRSFPRNPDGSAKSNGTRRSK